MKMETGRHHIPTWVRLGLREYFRPIGPDCWKKTCPGGRDLFWFTIFFSLAMCFGLILTGSRHGLLDNFSNTLLGYVPGYGIPISFAPHPVAAHEGIKRYLWQCSEKSLQDANAEFKALCETDEGNVAEPLLDEGVVGRAVFPYYDMGGRGMKAHYAGLPGKNIWNKAKESSPYYGLVVYADDPLWVNASQERANLNTTPRLILNLSVFNEKDSNGKKNFDYASYRSSLVNRIPDSWVERDLPESVHDLADLDSIWLSARVGENDELIRFDATWVDVIPSVVKPAFLFPMSLYQALEEASKNSDLRFYPEVNDENLKRVSDIIVLGVYGEEVELHKASEILSSCVEGDAVVQDGHDARIVLHRPRPIDLYETCVTQSGLPESQLVSSSVSGDRLIFHSDGFLEVPYTKLDTSRAQKLKIVRKISELSILGQYSDEEKIRLANCVGGKLIEQNKIVGVNQTSEKDISGCADDSGIDKEHIHFEKDMAIIDTLSARPHSHMVVYAPSRNELSQVVDRLKEISISQGKTQIPAFSLTPAYTDAINRFNYLTDTVSEITPVFAIFFIILITFFMLIMLNTMIDHRKDRYAVLLTRGVSSRHIYAMVFLQIFLAAVIGLMAAWIICKFAAYYLQQSFMPVFVYYKDLLSLASTEGPELLPLVLSDYIVTFASFLILAWVLAWLILRLAPISRDAEVSVLLQG